VVSFSPDWGWAITPPLRKDQLSILPNPHQVEVKLSLPLCLFGHQFCPRGVQSAHQLALNYVVPSRADDALCSPGRVAISLGRIKSALGWSRQGGV
jgi:hypothetical protein